MMMINFDLKPEKDETSLVTDAEEHNHKVHSYSMKTQVQKIPIDCWCR